MSRITDKVSLLARPVVEEAGCTLWDVEYVREAGTWYLRVYIDKDGGVSIDDCERISRELDPILDEADPIPDSYVFEVGSAGAEGAQAPRRFRAVHGQRGRGKALPAAGRREELRRHPEGVFRRRNCDGRLRQEGTQLYKGADGAGQITRFYINI